MNKGGDAIRPDDRRGLIEHQVRALPDGRTAAANALMDWLEEQDGVAAVRAVGHRVVHGMKHLQPELVTPGLLAELHRLRPYDPDHLPARSN